MTNTAVSCIMHRMDENLVSSFNIIWSSVFLCAIFYSMLGKRMKSGFLNQRKCLNKSV